MAFYYLDTSAIVKMYVDEPGTDFVVQLINNSQPSDRFYISFLTVLEFTSAIMRKVKGNTLREEVAAEIHSGLVYLDPLDTDAITQLNQMRSIADQTDD